MAVSTLLPRQSQMIVTLEPGAMVADIKKAMKMLKGVSGVRMAGLTDGDGITPALRRKIQKARREYANGETVSCSTPEEMQRYFDSL